MYTETRKFVNKTKKIIRRLEQENLPFNYYEAVELTQHIENGDIKDIDSFISGYKSYLAEKQK